MDYKNYLKTYTSYSQKNEKLIKEELQKAKNSRLRFEAAFQKTSKILYQTSNELRDEIKRLGLIEITYDSFKKEKSKYNSEDAIKMMLEPEGYIPTLYNVKAEQLELEVTYKVFIELLSNYHISEDTITYFYNKKELIELLYDTKKIESYYHNIPELLNAKDNLLAYSEKVTALAYEKENDLLSPEDKLWKSRIDSFTTDEKIILMHLFFQTRSQIKQPEFLKFIMITGGFFDSSIFNKDYKNSKLYKNLSEGPNYFKSEAKRELLTSLKIKLTPFKMIVFQNKLDIELISAN